VHTKIINHHLVVCCQLLLLFPFLRLLRHKLSSQREREGVDYVHLNDLANKVSAAFNMAQAVAVRPPNDLKTERLCHTLKLGCPFNHPVQSLDAKRGDISDVQDSS
jgi:hypothetical protein